MLSHPLERQPETPLARLRFSSSGGEECASLSSSARKLLRATPCVSRSDQKCFAGIGKDYLVLVDSHAHIDTSRFHADRASVIQAAVDGGVTRMVDPGCDLVSSRFAVSLAKVYTGVVFAGVGVHPHDATTYSEEVGTQLSEMAREPEVVAIGEFGLDYFRMLSPRDVQRAVFCAHLALAHTLNLPCIIHVRDSHDDVVELLRVHGKGLRGVFHCFSGTVAQAEECLSFDGFLLSFAGPLTKQGNELPQVASMVPLNRVLVETDSPYLVPRPLKARRNEPLFVRQVAEKLAEIRGMMLEEIAQITTANAVRLFGLGEQNDEIV